MTSYTRLWGLFAAVAVGWAVLAIEGCNGFGTTCSTDADCQYPAFCDPTLKVCFLPAGPFVAQIQPANDAGDVVAANAVVVATFSDIIADAGIKDTTFTVIGQGFQSPGGYLVTVDSADASVATFKPVAGGLSLGTDYVVTLTSAIKDLGGNTLAPFSSTFSTRDGVFTSGGSLRYTTQTGLYAMGTNYFGNVVTAVDYLLPSTETDFGVLGGVSAPGGNPTTATDALQATTGVEADYPTVGIASDGTAFAAWTNQPTGVDAGQVTYSAEVAFWDPNVQAWRYVQELSPPEARPQFPQVVGFNVNTGLAVWLETVADKQVVYGSYFETDAGWLPSGTIQTDQTLGANPAGTPGQLSVASDILGDALVAWPSEQATFDGGPPRILAAYLPGAGTFPPPVALSAADGPSQVPHVAMGIYGYGAVVWETGTAETASGTFIGHVFGSTLDATRPNPFSAAVQLDDAIQAYNPQVGVSANGNAVAIWQEQSDGGNLAIVSSSYTRVGDSWSAPVTLDSDPSNPIYSPAIAVDPSGNALAAWLKSTDAGLLLVRGGRYNVDGGWHSVTQLGASADPVYNFPVLVVVDGLGRGYVMDTRNPGNSLYLEFIPFQ
ncbi:MAG: Ig-like domain-containing protein [Myxococcaceae bacterium]